MHFGDRPAAIGLDVAKKLVAEAGKEIDSEAVEMIKRDYVDDGFGGGTEATVDRLMGETIIDGEVVCTGTVPQIMICGGFHIKYMIRDGETRPEVLEHYSGSVLGVPWDTAKDVIQMELEVNLSPKEQKQRTGEPVTVENLHLIHSVVLTRRIMLSQVHAIFDPAGLLAPVTIRYKLVLQKIAAAKYDWDQALGPDLLEECRDILSEMV